MSNATDTATLLAQLEALKAENAALKASKPGGQVTPKVSAKGAVSIYGLGKWPVTLYASQVIRLAEAFPAVMAFARDSADALTVKEGEDREAIRAKLTELADRFAK